MFDLRSWLERPVARLSVLVASFSIAFCIPNVSVVGASKEGFNVEDFFYLRSTGGAFWVSAAAAMVDGEIRWEFFDKYAEENIKNLKKAIEEQQALAETASPKRAQGNAASEFLDPQHCVVTSSNLHRDPESGRRTLADLEKNSLAFIYGEIRSIKQGFLAGDPMSILALQVKSYSALRENFTVPKKISIAYPYAAFSLGRYVFCAPDLEKKYRPVVGDSIYLLPSRDFVDIQYQLMTPGPEEILVETAQGEILPSEKLEAKDIFSLSSMQVGKIDIRGRSIEEEIMIRGVHR